MNQNHFGPESSDMLQKMNEEMKKWRKANAKQQRKISSQRKKIESKDDTIDVVTKALSHKTNECKKMEIKANALEKELDKLQLKFEDMQHKLIREMEDKMESLKLEHKKEMEKMQVQIESLKVEHNKEMENTIKSLNAENKKKMDDTKAKYAKIKAERDEAVQRCNAIISNLASDASVHNNGQQRATQVTEQKCGECAESVLFGFHYRDYVQYMKDTKDLGCLARDQICYVIDIKLRQTLTGAITAKGGSVEEGEFMKKVIEKAADKGIIHGQEIRVCEDLNRIRNCLVHFNGHRYSIMHVRRRVKDVMDVLDKIVRGERLFPNY